MPERTRPAASAGEIRFAGAFATLFVMRFSPVPAAAVLYQGLRAGSRLAARRAAHEFILRQAQDEALPCFLIPSLSRDDKLILRQAQDEALSCFLIPSLSRDDKLILRQAQDEGFSCSSS